MSKKKEILYDIENNPKIIRYKELETIIQSDQTLNKKMNEIKKIQQQIVHAEKLEKQELKERLNKEYEIMLKSVKDYPLMAEYLDLQVEINEMIQYMAEIIEVGLNSDLTSEKR